MFDKLKDIDWEDFYDNLPMYIVGGMMFLLILIMIISLGTILVIYTHDYFYQEKSYKSELLLLDDVQYMDDGRILYRFGDKVIKDFIIADDFNVNEIYEVVYIQYKNSWMHNNNVWKYNEIKEVN